MQLSRSPNGPGSPPGPFYTRPREASCLTYACVDIGSNTTRLLVAEVSDAGLREIATQRAYTRIGKAVTKKGIPADKIAEVVDTVETQVRHAQELGADEVAVVGTAAIREAKNASELASAIEERTGLPLRILTGDEEGHYSFTGAARSLAQPFDGPLAVIDVGGGSSEIVIGTLADGPSWTESFRIGSGFLADSYIETDPPSIQELEAIRAHVAGTFEGLDVPRAEKALAVGGTATSLRRLVGASLEHETLERSLRVLATDTVHVVAERFELDPQRVRLLPAGMIVLEEISDLLGLPLQIAGGGLREGVVLELAGAAAEAGG